MHALPRGIARLGTVLALVVICAAFPETLGGAIATVLQWTEGRASRPGLSGLVLLLMSPIAFLALAYLVRWVVDGFD